MTEFTDNGFVLPPPIEVDTTDPTVKSRMLRMWGVSTYAELKIKIDAYKAERIQAGEDARNIPDLQILSSTYRGILGFDRGYKNWLFKFYLKDGRVEEITVRAIAPRDGMSKILYANTLDSGRRMRWNNNLNSVTAEIIGDSSFSPLLLDNALFDRQVDFDTLTDNFINSIYPSRYNPYATRTDGRVLTERQRVSFLTEDGEQVENIQNVYDDTEPGTKTTPTDIAEDITDDGIISIGSITRDEIEPLLTAITTVPETT